MVGYIIRRVLWIIPVLLVVSFLTFSLMKATPGGPWDREKELSDRQKALLNAKYGLDDPFMVQYVRWLVGWPDEDGFQRGIILGDLGPSYRYPDRTVNDIVADGILVTIQLGVMAFALVGAGGHPVGGDRCPQTERDTGLHGHLRQRAWHLHAQLRGGHPLSDRVQPRLRLVPDRWLEGAGVLGAAHPGARPGAGGGGSAVHPGQHARGDAQGLHPHGAQQGAQGAHCGRDPHDPQRADPGRHHPWARCWRRW